MVKRPTIADIAREAGVSTALVSYALNDKPGVAPATRRRVLAIAQARGWRPSSTARALSGHRPHTVGLAVVAPTAAGGQASFLELFAAMDGVLVTHDIETIFHVVPSVAAMAATFTRWAGEHRVDAAVLVDVAARDDERLVLLRGLGLPHVVVAEQPAGTVTRVVCGGEESAYGKLGAHLASLGHRLLGHVAGEESRSVTAARSRGLAAGMGPGGVVLTRHCDLSPAASSGAVRRLLDLAERPTVLVFDDDVAAAMGLEMARRHGLQVPWDLSVVSGVDSTVCAAAVPAITALSSDRQGLGVRVAHELLDLLGVLHAPPVGASLEQRAGALAIRATTAPPPMPAAVANRA